MAHKTLIDGTSYEVTGGRTLVDGTGYDITGGKTLVDGTGYDVSFGVTWAVYSVSTKYTYDGTYITKAYTAGSSIYMSDSSDTSVIKYTTSAPSACSGTYSAKQKPPWKNTFTDTGITKADLPSSISSTRYYLFYVGTGVPSHCRIYKTNADGTLSTKSSMYASLDVAATAYEANMVETSVKGSTQYDNVTAPEGTYPDNGISGDYWYVRLT